MKINSQNKFPILNSDKPETFFPSQIPLLDSFYLLFQSFPVAWREKQGKLMMKDPRTGGAHVWQQDYGYVNIKLVDPLSAKN